MTILRHGLLNHRYFRWDLIRLCNKFWSPKPYYKVLKPESLHSPFHGPGPKLSVPRLYPSSATCMLNSSLLSVIVIRFHSIVSAVSIRMFTVENRLSGSTVCTKAFYNSYITAVWTKWVLALVYWLNFGRAGLPMDSFCLLF